MKQRLIELEHFAQVYLNNDHGYRAECSCGWASDWHADDDGAAEDAAIDHYEVAVGQPDSLDRLLGELLDLQDNLAQAVIWFAENWSTDLPAPRLYPREVLRLRGLEDRDHVALLVVACPDPAIVGRIAALIGATVTGTESGARVSGRFGRVRLEAVVALDTEAPYALETGP